MEDKLRSKLMTPDELAEYLRVDKATVEQIIREREIPALRIGDKWRLGFFAQPPEKVYSRNYTAMFWSGTCANS